MPKIMQSSLDKLLAEVESYAAAKGVQPSTVLRKSFNAGHGVYASLRAGKSDLHTNTVDQIRQFMRDNK